MPVTSKLITTRIQERSRNTPHNRSGIVKSYIIGWSHGAALYLTKNAPVPAPANTFNNVYKRTQIYDAVQINARVLPDNLGKKVKGNVITPLN